jgi:membrane-bound lytic murein transglycosylase B
VVLAVATVVVIALVAVVAWVALRPRGSGTTPATAPRWAPAPAAPAAAADPGAGIQTLAHPDWVASTAQKTGIPERALVAYAGAALRKAQEMPSCGISWATLAAIGSVESDHGRHGGSHLDADGVAVPPIYGIALDGTSTDRIPDSDGGAIDGDPDHDRAVGPMQLIPQAWRNWHVDADADGTENPQDIDDATLATTNYLCRVSSMTTEAGWRAAIAGYNSDPAYLAKVATRAVAYAAAAG